MRTLEQRLEEIRRRGMALRRKRKAKQMVCTVACTLVFFGAGLWMVFSAPASVAPSQIHLQDTTSPTTEQLPTCSTEKPEFSLHSPTMPEPQLEIRHAGEVYLCTDSARLLEIRELLDTVTTAGDFMCTEDSFSDAASDFQDDYMADSVPETQLFFALSDGSTEVYTLEGNVLTDQSTGGRYVLTPDALLKLNQLLRKDDVL